MKPLTQRPLKEPKYIYFDFEGNQETGIHEMNYCIAYDGKTLYKLTPDSTATYSCRRDIEKIELDKLNIDNISDYFNLLDNERDKRKVIDKFCETFISKNFKNYTFISHYGKGYDMQPILGWLVKNKIDIKEISIGLKIIYIEVKGTGIRFIDSFGFTLMGIKGFPTAFGFKGNKGHFPYYFNTTKNQNYIGKYPALKYYGYKEINKDSKKDIEEWYETVKDKTFDFQKEIFYYCLLDVLILAKGCNIYRNNFLTITKNCLDPFQSITLPQFCTKLFKTFMLPENTIGIHKSSTFEDNQSYKAIQWLESFNNKGIQHAKRGGEKIIDDKSKSKKYKLDGYYYDRETKTRFVYEFFGCYFHGCPKCYHPEEICKRKGNKTMKKLYDETMNRLEDIKEYYKDHNLKIITIWEHEFDKEKYPPIDEALKPINKRDAFYGGRTETFHLYNNTENLRGKYVDFVSLYPTVNKYDEYPIGHPKTLINVSPSEYIERSESSKENKYFGIMKCKILPPRKLLIPVLPYKQKTKDAHKLIFGLCKTCMESINIDCGHINIDCNQNKNGVNPTKYDKIHAMKKCKKCKDFRNKKCNHSDKERIITGTWSTIEINKALEKGYKLIQIYELEYFEETTKGLFGEYVDTFMKYKLEASGCKCNRLCRPGCENDNECEAKIQYIADNIAYELNIDKVKYNAGLRLIAKICLNNLWGHFGMKDDYTTTEYVHTTEQLTNIVYNDKYKDVSFIELDEDTDLVEYKTKEHYKKPNPNVNIYIALYTTAHARLRLYDLLDTLQEKVMYCDTDSVIFNDDDSEACKKVKSMIGTGLGQLTDELLEKHKAEYIKRFVSTGPKDYCMELNTGKIVNICKGFKINSEAEEKITIDKKIKLVTDTNEKYDLIKYKQIKINKKDRVLKNVKQSKMYDFEFDKRMINYENENLITSLPYGF